MPYPRKCKACKKRGIDSPFYNCSNTLYFHILNEHQLSMDEAENLDVEETTKSSPEPVLYLTTKVGCKKLGTVFIFLTPKMPY